MPAAKIDGLSVLPYPLVASNQAKGKPASLISHRPDIDGLRAIAVLAVIFSHLAIPGFGGGFIGVDIFFVISGFLIACLILAPVGQGRFSIAAFYERRMRRILPALFAAIAAVLVIALVLLMPGELVNFAKSLAATVLFSSNLYFWYETDYFAAQAATKPLLHTWSLGVEEQFYIVFPLLALLLARFSRAYAMAVLFALALASFAWCVWTTRTVPGNAFFLPQFRAWELLSGALLAYSGRNAPKGAGNIAASAGLALIAASIILIDSETPFPGWFAGAPVLGTLLILYGGATATWAVACLRWAPSRFMGRISYSAYLVHWPLVAFFNYYFFRQPTWPEAAGVLALTITIAAASWRWIEQPCRHARISRKTVFGTAAIGMVALTAAALLVIRADGWPDRYPSQFEKIASTYHDRVCHIEPGQPISVWAPQRCTFGRSGQPTVFVFGDSFAAQYVPGLVGLNRYQVVQATFGACPPVLDPSLPCAEFNKHIIATILQTKPDLVLLSAAWRGLKPLDRIDREMSRVVGLLRGAGLNVMIVGDAPQYFSDMLQVQTMMRRRGISTEWYPPVRNEWADPILAKVAAAQGAAFYAPRRFWCLGDKCRFTDGQLFTLDIGHLTSHGSALIARELQPIIDLEVAGKY